MILVTKKILNDKRMMLMRSSDIRFDNGRLYIVLLEDGVDVIVADVSDKSIHWIKDIKENWLDGIIDESTYEFNKIGTSYVNDGSGTYH